MTPDDPHIAVIGPLALAALEGSCPPEVLEDKVEETGWGPPPEMVVQMADDGISPLNTEGVLSAIVRYWRECQATAALRAAPPDGAGTYYHETPRQG
jgi:hypothetical protein